MVSTGVFFSFLWHGLVIRERFGNGTTPHGRAEVFKRCVRNCNVGADGSSNHTVTRVMANSDGSFRPPVQGSTPLIEEAVSTHPVEELSRIELLQQLERIVNSKYFRNSKRYPVLLRFVVEQTLAGHADLLKERTLGMTVFDRDSDYDSNLDPIVRVTAGEVRKRIAQYYQEPGHEHEWKIYMPLGSYVPRFLFPTDFTPSVPDGLVEAFESPAAPVASDGKPASVVLSASTAMPASRRRRYWTTLILLTAVSLLATVALPAFKSRHPRDQTLNPASEYFWRPLLSSRNPVLIVLGVHSLDSSGNDMPVLAGTGATEPQPKDMITAMLRSNMVPLSDIVAYSRVTDLLTQHSQLYRTQGSRESTLEEIRRGPVLLVGGLDNAWTLRLQSALRFRLFAPDKLCGEIFDGQHPETSWRFDNTQRTTGNSRDYAIVASYYDRSIAQHVLVLAGIGMAGTKAAAEFVTSNEELQSWLNGVRPDRPNVEIVLSTEILDGQPGPPHVIATSTW
jgi:hypothetical protein